MIFMTGPILFCSGESIKAAAQPASDISLDRGAF